MRTTLTIDDDIFAIARNLAAAKHLSIGAALSELARRGLNQTHCYDADSDLPHFQVSENAPVFGLAQVKSVEDEP
jgi:hypothetical protein